MSNSKTFKFADALRLVNHHLEALNSPRHEIAVCGGTALIALGLIERTTRDVDIVALLDEGELIAPAPLPALLLEAAERTAGDLGLLSDWLNNEPIRNEGGLFQLGLSDGFASRLVWVEIGEKLRVGYASRIDQIHFKLYAAVDRMGGYHLDDLIRLSPRSEELTAAARWARTINVSRGFAELQRQLLEGIGFGDVAQGL